VLQSTADTEVFRSDAHTLYAPLASTDKRLDFVAGDHYRESPRAAREEIADRLLAWLRERGA
jgi:esterase/lipase